MYPCSYFLCLLKMSDRLRKSIAKACLKAGDQEACGVVIDGKVIPLENTSDEPCSSFVISAHDYLKYLPDTIYHSHPTGTEGFSSHDIAVATNLALTSYVYVVESDRVEKYSQRAGLEIFNDVLKP